MSTVVELNEYRLELQALLEAAAVDFDYDMRVRVEFLTDLILTDEVTDVVWRAVDRAGEEYALAYNICTRYGKPLHSLEEARVKVLETFVETMRGVERGGEAHG